MNHALFKLELWIYCEFKSSKVPILDFKSPGEVYPQIKLVDVYQIPAHVVGVPPQANNGTWEGRIHSLKVLQIGPSEVCALPLAAGINVSGHYFWYIILFFSSACYRRC